MDTEKRKFGNFFYTKWLQTAPAELLFPPVSMSPGGVGWGADASDT